MLGLISAGALIGLGPYVTKAAAQSQITPPARSDLIPPDQRNERRAPTLTIDGDLVRAPCALDQPQFADLRFTLKETRFAGLERAGGLSLAGSETLRGSGLLETHVTQSRKEKTIPPSAHIGTPHAVPSAACFNRLG